MAIDYRSLPILIAGGIAINIRRSEYPALREFCWNGDALGGGALL